MRSSRDMEENMVVGFYSEGTIWGEEVGEYKSIAGTPLATDVSLTSQKIQPASSTVFLTSF